MKLLVITSLICISSAVLAMPHLQMTGEDRNGDTTFYTERCDAGDVANVRMDMVCVLMKHRQEMALLIGALCNSDVPQDKGRELCNQFAPRVNRNGDRMKKDIEHFTEGENDKGGENGNEETGNRMLLTKLFHVFGNTDF